jgi:DNA-binding NtrC family response regulator
MVTVVTAIGNAKIGKTGVNLGTSMQSDRILVVDDEEAIREIVASMLISANYECRQASSGLEALALLNSGEQFELMLSDLMMAELDGIGLLERTKETYPDMPVVMVHSGSRYIRGAGRHPQWCIRLLVKALRT